MFKRWFCAALLAVVGVHAVAAEDADKAVRDAVKKVLPNAKINLIERSKLEGFYQVVADGQVLYFSADGKYLIHGSVFDIESRQDLGEKSLAVLRKSTMAKIPLDKQIVFAPPNPKYRVTVFTDVDCPYCREFHKQIAEYNKRGVAVNYVLFPLPMHKGADKKAEAVWCSADRNTAYTDAMNGKSPGDKVCTNPVSELTEISKSMGVEGTPAVFNADGEHVGGYMTPDQLVQRLDQLAQKTQAVTAK